MQCLHHTEAWCDRDDARSGMREQQNIMEKIEHINYIKTSVAKVYEALTTQEGLGETWTRLLVIKPERNFIQNGDFSDNYTTKNENY